MIREVLAERAARKYLMDEMPMGRLLDAIPSLAALLRTHDAATWNAAIEAACDCLGPTDVSGPIHDRILALKRPDRARGKP